MNGTQIRPWLGFGVVMALGLASGFPTVPALASDDKSPIGSASPDGQEAVVKVDTTLPIPELAEALILPQQAVASLLDGLGQSGRWLLPPRCATPQADNADPAQAAVAALYEQDAQGVREAANEGLAALVCRQDAVGSDELAAAWYYLGVAEVLEGQSADRYFGAIQALPPGSYVAPDLGKRVREAFDNAAPAAASGLVTLSPPAGSGPWWVDGVEATGPIPLAPVPHVIQLGSAGEARWTALLMPGLAGSMEIVGFGTPEPLGDLGPAALGAHRADVARWLRVIASRGGAPADDDGRAIAAAMPPSPWVLSVEWAPPGQEAKTWAFRSRQVAVAPAPPEVETVERPGEVEHRVSVGAALGSLTTRGAAFFPLAVEVAILLKAPLRLELGVAMATDMGLQDDRFRYLANGRAAIRVDVRADLGLSMAFGGHLVTRGPDPADPTVFVLETYPGTWLRWRPRAVFKRAGPFVELGVGLAPGIWRSDAAPSEPVGLMAHALLGFERR